MVMMSARMIAFGLPLLVAAVLVPATAPAQQSYGSDPDRPTLEQRYRAAILDAMVATPDEIVTDLFAINDSNPDLVWQDYESRDRVLVVSWMTADDLSSTFPDAIGNPDPRGVSGRTPDGSDIWVTAVPQMRRFCQALGLTGGALDIRLKQYLGLNPAWPMERIAEFWVGPATLFRPCPDPQIGDRQCTIEGTPLGLYGPLPPAAFQEWFRNQIRIAYGPDGAPWTRLGYTFDWGNPATRVGASEYVVGRGVDVVLHSLTMPDVYCAGP